jgi:hypothetical protein
MVGDDEAKVRGERARAIGLFRYQLIREAADAAHSTIRAFRPATAPVVSWLFAITVCHIVVRDAVACRYSGCRCDKYCPSGFQVAV